MVIVMDKLNFKRRYQRMYGYDEKYREDNKDLIACGSAKTILDVACGVGTFVELSPHRIVGVDRSPESINVCLKKGLDVFNGEATDLPFIDNTFDAVHCSNVIEHLTPEDAHKMLVEINRVLKVNGRLVLRTALQCPTFWDDFTHVKPYYPNAILHYLNEKRVEQISLKEISNDYKLISLRYNYPQLFESWKRSNLWIIGSFFNVLRKFGIGSLKANSFVMVFRKGESKRKSLI
jgi:ubiquinone/menaquinone biosynthesis C-methylase UbiE